MKQFYNSPELEVLTIGSEQGFATSGGTIGNNEDFSSGNGNWGN